SITAATAPSPVTLVAVPKLSCATYKAIMKATAASLKPRLVISTPLAAIIAPPGTPGAAIITTPSSKITTSISQRPGISYTGSIVITAIEQLSIVIVEPDKWVVAHKGITKSAILFLIPFVFVRSKVTGIVAAEDIVPSAVKYAGSIFFNIANGFFLISEPATVYCTRSQTKCMII